MKLKNISDKTANVRSDGKWLVVKSGEVKDLPDILASDKRFAQVDQSEPVSSEAELDLNNDGKFDEKDKSIAGRVLRKVTKSKKKKKYSRK